MLNSIRKFSSSPYAKVLMGIVILPFVMWGMGDVFRGGKQNTIVEIDKKKISAQDFGDYINSLNVSYEDVKKEDTFNKILSNFIARQLIAADSKKLKINVSDQSLAKMIQNNESFKKDKKFSRTKYEKFLLSSNLTAFQFEQGLTENEIKDQLLKFISGGIKSPEFLINRQYDLKNQIRNILVVDLNDIYKKKLIFSDDEIKNYYDNNISAFSEEYRSIKYSTLTPSTLTGKEEFSNSFFEALDEIEDSIISDVGIENISKKFGLQIKEVKLFNIKGKKANGSSVDNSLSDIINKIFKINLSDPLVLINQNENYLMVSLEEIKKVPENIDSEKIINEISSKLKRLTISKENSNLIEKIITNKFVKTDFDNLAGSNNLKIQKIQLNGVSDNKTINKELVDNIYQLPEKQIYVFSDRTLSKNLLVYIDKIKHVKINRDSENYKDYNEQTINALTNNIYKTYDKYLNNKYQVNINNNAVERVKNFFK